MDRSDTFPALMRLKKKIAERNTVIANTFNSTQLNKLNSPKAKAYRLVAFYSEAANSLSCHFLSSFNKYIYIYNMFLSSSVSFKLVLCASSIKPNLFSKTISVYMITVRFRLDGLKMCCCIFIKRGDFSHCLLIKLLFSQEAISCSELSFEEGTAGFK